MLFTGSSDALQRNLWWIFIVMDGYVEGDLYRNREERVWHWNTASTYRTV